MIPKPMLACSLNGITAKEFSDIKDTQYYLQPKLDGIRCICSAHACLSRYGRPIANRFIRTTLMDWLKPFDHYKGWYLDGELLIKHSGGSFQDTVSGIMSRGGTPDFTYNVFDVIHPGTRYHYDQRYDNIAALLAAMIKPYPFRLVKMLSDEPLEKDDLNSIQHFAEWNQENSPEGLIIRDRFGVYKHGRSTLRESALFKWKHLLDAEAVVIAFEELQKNENDPTTNALGYTERSNHKAWMVGQDTLGSLVCNIENGQFKNMNVKIGSGFTASERNHIWCHRDHFLGKKLTFTYQPVGSKDLPRQPVFKCWFKQ